MQTNCQSLLGKGLNGCNARRFHHDGPARSKRCETYPVPHPPSTLTWYPGAWAYFVIVFVFVQWAHFEIVILMCLLRGALCIHRYLLTLYSYLFNGLVLCLYFWACSHFVIIFIQWAHLEWAHCVFVLFEGRSLFCVCVCWHFVLCMC